MPQSTFECKNCNTSKIVTFKLGEKPEVFCELCKTLMVRVYGQTFVGNIVEDKMIDAADTMLYGTLPSGADKRVF